MRTKILEMCSSLFSVVPKSPGVLMVSLQCTEHPPLYSWYPSGVLNIPRCTHDNPYMHLGIPQCTHDNSQCTEHPHCTYDIPTLIMVNLQCTHGIPQCTEHPSVYSLIMVSPQCTHDILLVYSRYPPLYS